MSWMEVEPVIGARASKSRERVRLRCSARSGVSITISEALCERLGWIKGKTKLRLLLGAAESAGRIRLAPDAAGKLTVVNGTGKGGARIGAMHWEGLDLVALKGAPVEWDVPQQAVLEIVLPPELAALAQAKAPVRPPAPALPEAPKNDVSGQLMGDPSPGRSAAARAERRPSPSHR